MGIETQKRFLFLAQFVNIANIRLFCAFAALSLGYFLVNIQITGPAYLSDEVSYLTKAASISGHIVDNATSWSAGYPILLSPIFYFVSDPSVSWRLVVLVNSMLFASSILILGILLRRLFPSKSPKSIILAQAVSALYPSWMIMSGYAFVSALFILLLMLILLVISHEKINNLRTSLKLGVLAGVLYWVHPLAIAIVAGIAVTYLVFAIGEKKYKPVIVFIFTAILIALIYLKGFHPLLNAAMTPEGYSQNSHYSGLRPDIQKIFSIAFIGNFFTMVLAHFAYALVATFGVAAVFALTFAKKLFNIRNKKDRDERLTPVVLLLGVSMLSIVAMGAYTFNAVSETGLVSVDEWIYGRYIDMVLLPVIGIGLLLPWKKRIFSFAALYVLIIGLLLVFYATAIRTRDWTNFVNLTAMWPLALTDSNNFFTWLAIGAVGVLLVGWLGKRISLFFVLPLLIMTVVFQLGWHRDILSGHSKTSGLYKVISDINNQNDCVAIDPRKDPIERTKLYSYYFYDKNVERMTYAQWAASDCIFYLSYEKESAYKKSSFVLGREETSGLFLISKVKVPLNTLEKLSGYDNFYVNNEINNPSCVVNGCFERRGDELKDFMDIGIAKDTSIFSSRKAGFLLYGPYDPLDKGSYKLVIEGSFDNMSGAFIDIQDGDTQRIIVSSEAESLRSGSKLVLPFKMDSNVEKFEVRVRASSDSVIRFDRYIILSDSATVK